MQCMNAICGASLLIKPLKPDLHSIIAGAVSVHKAETIFHESSLLVKTLSKCFSHRWALQLFSKKKLYFNFLSFSVMYKCDKLVEMSNNGCFIKLYAKLCWASVQICCYLNENVLTNVIYSALNNVI